MNTSLRLSIAALALATSAGLMRGEDFTYTTNNGTITITGYTGPGGAVVIPENITGLPVTSIGIWAFAQCDDLTSVVIPDSVTSVRYCAFFACYGLTMVTIPSSVASIEEEAFVWCSALTNVNIPSSVLSIGAGAFGCCPSLMAITVDAGNPAYCSEDGVLFNKNRNTLIQYPGGRGRNGSYVVPNGVTKIADKAFTGCRSLTSVTIPDSVVSIGYEAFVASDNLTCITLGCGVTSIGEYAFWECRALTAVCFRGNAPHLGGSNVFSGTGATVYYDHRASGWGQTFGGRPIGLWDAEIVCLYRMSDGAISITRYVGSGGAVSIPSTINSLMVAAIGDSAFEGCSALTNITIPKSIGSIGHSAFRGCSGLTSIVIPDRVTNIGNWAFLGCSALTNITIPDRVIFIGLGAFGACSKLWAIAVDTANPAYCSTDGVLFNQGKSTLIQWPGGRSGTYAIPQSVTNIGDWAFEGCSALTSVMIPNSVISIGESAFALSGLSNVTIPNSVTSIGDRVFYECSALTNVTIPSSVLSIGESAFALSGLFSVTIPNNVTTIGPLAFQGCPELTTVSIGESVTNIGSKAFVECAKLAAINTDPLNKSYASEDGVLFSKEKTMLIGCPSGKSGAYVIPSTVTTIAEVAFYSCANLTSLSIPESVTSIGWHAFEGCSNLTHVIIPQPKPQPAAHPLVGEMLHGIQTANLYSLMRQITGEEPVLVGHETALFTNRLTGSTSLRKATQFAFEQLQALGLQVEYQPWKRAWMSGITNSDRNLVAIQPGVSRSEEIVVIGAHFDDASDTDRAPGADDNGSGSAAVLTAARICSQYCFERTIHFVLFTGEEQHGLGSQEYVAQAVAGGSNLVAVLAPDMIGYASPSLESPTCSLWTWGVPQFGLEGSIGAELGAMFTLGHELEALFTNVVAVYGLTNLLSCSSAHPGMWGIPSDAEFFFENGYSTLLPSHAHWSANYHTSADTLGALNFSFFTAMVQAIAGTAAHLAGPVDRNPLEVIEVANSDWTPGSDLGGGRFSAKLADGARETSMDSQDLPWSGGITNSPFNRELQIYSEPYGVPLQTDARPSGSDTLFRMKLAVADVTGTGVSGNTRLRFTPLSPAGNNRIYLARVHVDGPYLVTGRDFDCVANLYEVFAAGGFLDLPALLQVPDGAVYGTCDIAARLLNQDAANCRLRLVSMDSSSIVLSATAQVGARIVDDLEVCTNLAPPITWTFLKSYTNAVSPDATHFEAGWTEVVRQARTAALPEATSYFFRVKRAWIGAGGKRGEL